MKHINFLFIISIIAFSNVNAQDFLLSGRLVGFEDNTKIILNPYLDNMDIDMENETLILLKDGKFKFTKQLDKPTKFSLRVRPQNQENIVEYEHLTFWAENVHMHFEGTKGKIFQAKITGSKIQSQYFEYIQSVAKFKFEAKQIIDSVKTLPNISENKKSKMRVRYYAALKSTEEKRMEFVYKNPNYYCTAPELVFHITFSPDKIEQNRLHGFYKKMNLTIKSNIYGSQIGAFLADNRETVKSRQLKIGDYPYNFKLHDTLGNEIEFSSINCKLILLDFWASGCGPCRMEHKNYVKFYKEFKNKGLEIVSVSQDQSKKKLVDAMEKDGINWISLWDEKKKVSINQYSVSSLPTNYLIVNGKIVATKLRGEKLYQKIKSILN